MELEEHYGQLLGVNSPWEIYRIELKVENQRLDIWIEYTDDEGPFPECGATCPRYDTRKKCSWRHLDIVQFATYLHCEVPRVRCKRHGVRILSVPSAGKNRRFTLLFEAFAMRVLKVARSVEEARKQLGLNWHRVDAIKARAVERGLARRQKTRVDYLDIDVKQFRFGHNYQAVARIQLTSATGGSIPKNTRLGVLYPKHFRGRLFSFSTICSTCAWERVLKSAPLGRYCRISPFVFSFRPRS